MTFAELLGQVRELLRSKGRVSYRALQLQFNLDDAHLDGLKDELIEAERVADDENGKVLVWVGEEQRAGSKEQGAKSEGAGRANSQLPSSTSGFLLPPSRADGERRQLTVMFCDLVGSTALSAQLDPEELREVVQQYQETCTEVIRRYDGYVAQHLGDGLLVYFGYPAAHEDEAARAVRAGTEIIEALHSSPLQHRQLPNPIQVRIGIHTGVVVIGEIGSSEKREMLALGETPNIAARVQGVAEPDTVVVSAATQRLVQGLFEYQDLGPQTLKGISSPMLVYRVIGESAVQSRFEVAVGAGLTPLVGREEELGLLQQRWMQAKNGAGQVVLLSGEAGIGKSRLMQALKEQASSERALRIEFRCWPHHQNSALYPIIEHLQRLLQFASHDPPPVKVTKLQQTLARYRFPQTDTLPLLSALLSLPHPEGAPPITLSPQKQKQKTQEALVAWIVEEAENAAVFCAWEDLHWADPSTLEVLTLFLGQIPTARVFSVLTFRPEFTPPWSSRSYLTQLTLNRLGRGHVEVMVKNVTGGKSLPAEVLQQIVTKTDGVPLFVEELTKSVVESVEAHGPAPLHSLTIPATLQDSLMARLDRLGPTKEIAQVGAIFGREFSYELLQTVSSFEEGVLQQGLRQLVEAELLYQRGLPPQAAYLFKHALIQDTAYQSLLKSTRLQYHQRIAHVLESDFPEAKETQPELLAHHYTEAGLAEQAIPYWQQAGERASQRSAYVEAVAHLTKGLELLKALPDTPERVRQEFTLQLALGVPFMATKGYAAPDVEKTFTQARELCQQLGETPQLVPVLWSLVLFYFNRGEVQMAHEVAEQMMHLAQSAQDRFLLSLAHKALGWPLYLCGEFSSARLHVEQAVALYDPQQHPRSAVNTADPRLDCLIIAAWSLWYLGYPDQALKRSQEALALAGGLSRPFNLAMALGCTVLFYLLRREKTFAQELTERTISLSSEHGFAQWLTVGNLLRGWILTEQGQMETGITYMEQGLAAYRAMGVEVYRPYYLALLAEANGKAGRVKEGFPLLTEALATVQKTGEQFYEAELYRLKGELTLPKLSAVSSQLSVPSPQPLTYSTQAEVEAEACFLQAIDIARQQQAKSLELRASTSLARLWQSQGKRAEAHHLLSEIYYWFTEGFDTKDLQEAKALVDGL